MNRFALIAILVLAGCTPYEAAFGGSSLSPAPASPVEGEGRRLYEQEVLRAWNSVIANASATIVEANAIAAGMGSTFDADKWLRIAAMYEYAARLYRTATPPKSHEWYRDDLANLYLEYAAHVRAYVVAVGERAPLRAQEARDQMLADVEKMKSLDERYSYWVAGGTMTSPSPVAGATQAPATARPTASAIPAPTPQPTPQPAPQPTAQPIDVKNLRIRIVIADTGTEPRSTEISALPQWWTQATRGLSNITLVAGGAPADWVLWVRGTTPSQYAGLHWSNKQFLEVYTRFCSDDTPARCWHIPPAHFRMTVLHEIAHEWCCYSGAGISGDGHWSCSALTEIMCVGPGETALVTYNCRTPECTELVESTPPPLVFSDRELRVMGLLQ